MGLRHSSSSNKSPPPTPTPVSTSVPVSASSSNSSLGESLQRSASHERMTLFLNESRDTIASLAEEIVEESDCDINVYITAPPATGATQFCTQFEALTGKRFRFAASTLVPPRAAVRPSDRTITRIGQVESVRKHVLVDVAKHWDKINCPEDSLFDGESANKQIERLKRELERQVGLANLSDAVRLKYEADLREFDLLQQVEENARARDGKFRFRVIEGNILDASTVPIQTNKRTQMLSDLAQASLEMTGAGTWERWTRTAPISSSLFVYIKYDDAAFQASYRAYCSRRDVLQDEQVMLQQLSGFNAEQKASLDKVYYDGSPASVCGGYFVYVLCCPTAAITQPAHSQFMIQEILKTIQALQKLPRVWGAASVDSERAAYLRTPGWVSGRIKTVPCNLFGGSYISPHTATRRNSLDESRSSSLSSMAPGKKIRRGSLDLGTFHGTAARIQT